MQACAKIQYIINQYPKYLHSCVQVGYSQIIHMLYDKALHTIT